MPGTLKLNSGGAGNLILTPSGSVGSDVTVTLPAATATLLTNKTAGTVLQVVSTNLTTCLSTTSTSYVDTGLTVAITPSSASSKVLVKISLNDISKSDSGLVGFNLTRNGSIIVNNTTSGTGGTTYQAWNTFGGFGQTRVCAAASLTYLDSPATTSALTYKVQVRVEGGTGYLNQWGLNTDASAVSTITVMEIAG